MKKRILIIGACGQIGTELTIFLRSKYGSHKVIASDIRKGDKDLMKSGPFEILDAMDYDAIQEVVIRHEITDVYLMAAMLSATAEKFPMKAWNLNMNSLFHILNLAKEKKNRKSILAFEYCRIWFNYTQNRYATTHCNGTKHGLWHQQTNWRALVRILSQPIWSRCSQHPISRTYQLQNCSRWRHYRLCGGYLSQGIKAQKICMFP